MSAEDLEKGVRWGIDLAEQLDSTDAGIICLTPENLGSMWIAFEAGALSKTLENSLVCPYLLGVRPSEIAGPLTQFQAAQAEKSDTFKLLQSVNSRLENASLTEERLGEAFEIWWPKLEATILSILEQPPESSLQPELETTGRSDDRHVLDEILNLVRTLARESSSKTPSGNYQRSNSILGHLSAAERELFEMVRERRSSAEIASILDISEPAARQRLSRMYRKLGASGRNDVILLGMVQDGIDVQNSEQEAKS